MVAVTSQNANTESLLGCAHPPLGSRLHFNVRIHSLQNIPLPQDHRVYPAKAFYCIKKFKHGELELPFMDEPFRAY